MSWKDEAVFDEVTKLVEEELGSDTPGDIRHSFREKVLSKSNLGVIPSEVTFTQANRSTVGSNQERFLDTEVVAIYW